MNRKGCPSRVHGGSIAASAWADCGLSVETSWSRLGLCNDALSVDSMASDGRMRIWWNESWQWRPKYSEKTYLSALLPTTNPTWPDLGSNSGRRRLTAWATVQSIEKYEVECIETAINDPISKWDFMVAVMNILLLIPERSAVSMAVTIKHSNAWWYLWDVTVCRLVPTVESHPRKH
jgi:hypothetical protein